jgi:hypothetical protein
VSSVSSIFLSQFGFYDWVETEKPMEEDTLKRRGLSSTGILFPRGRAGGLPHWGQTPALLAFFSHTTSQTVSHREVSL